MKSLQKSVNLARERFGKTRRTQDESNLCQQLLVFLETHGQIWYGREDRIFVLLQDISSAVLHLRDNLCLNKVYSGHSGHTVL